MSHTVGFAVLATSMVAFTLSTGVYLVRGEQALRKFRSRYPVPWASSDKPSFFVFSVRWDRYWSTAAASNFFTFREYRTLDDSDLSRECDVVRVWQFVSWAALASIFLSLYALS